MCARVRVSEREKIEGGVTSFLPEDSLLCSFDLLIMFNRGGLIHFVGCFPSYLSGSVEQIQHREDHNYLSFWG